MQKSIFDLVGNLDTLLAVALGAILATSGALFAELVQDRLNRKRRERDAARFFGEVMSSMDRILEAAVRSKSIGEPWGPVTRRLFRTALREAGVYERNRERLFDIRDLDLRTRIHTHMVRKTFPIDAIIDYSGELERIHAALLENDAGAGTERRDKLEARAGELCTTLDGAFEAMCEEMQNTKGLCGDLERLARVRFGERYEREPAAEGSATENNIASAAPTAGE